MNGWSIQRPFHLLDLPCKAARSGAGMGMRLFLFTAVTMTAFAFNSILNRVGVADYGMDPMVFAVIRTIAGAVMLVVLVMVRGRRPDFGHKRFAGALALAVYMVGFSWAYLTLGAGLGALILFAVLQVVMFGFAVRKRQTIPLLRWFGAGIALIGLGVLLWPAGTAVVPLVGAVAMAIAGASWAVYTLLGQGEPDALAASAGNFVLCVPLVALALLGGWGGALSFGGIAAAVVAGAVTSGLGYAMWYRVLPQIPTTIAAITQLSVPVIAVVAGVLLLDEVVTTRLLIAGVLVLGGIAVSLMRKT